MKIAEKFIDNHDGTFVVQRQFHNDPYLKRAEELRQEMGGKFGESRLAGTIPMHLVEQWAKEAGVKFGGEEMKEVIRKKLLSGDFDKLRVWHGSY